MQEKYLGQSIAKLGFGLMRLPEKKGEIDIEQTSRMVDRFMESGFTYFDTAYVYGAGKSEEAACKALTSRYPRDSFQLADKLPIFELEDEATLEPIFQTSLCRSGVEYFDFYLLHCITKDSHRRAEEHGAWEFVKKVKERGLARHIGFSFHDSAEVLDQVLTAHPETEFVQLQINYLDWEDEKVQARLCYEVARKHGKPVIIMEPVKGGALASGDGRVVKLLGDASGGMSPAAVALRYAASLEGVITVLSGMSDLAQMEDNLSAMTDFRPVSSEEKEAIAKVVDIFRSVETIPCTACRYCVDGCPRKINIPGIFSAVNRWHTYKTPGIFQAEYKNAVKDGGKASDCIACGQCENHCPQHISIMEELKKAASEME